MNKRISFSVALCLMLSIGTAHPVRVLVDKIKMKVNDTIITHSQSLMPQVANNGKPFTSDQYIAHVLWYERAKDRNMLPSDDEVTRNINQYKQENDLASVSDEQADELLMGKIGMDFATYRQQIHEYFAIESLKSYEFRNRCSVAEAEVRAFYDAHPVVEPARYTLEIAPITPSQIAEWKKGKYSADDCKWDLFEDILESALAPHLKSVRTLAAGTVFVATDPQGSESSLVRLVEKKESRMQTLTERYHRIEIDLQRKKVEQYALDSEKELYRNAVVTLS